MTAPADWERVRDLFHRALELPPEHRASFIRREAADDAHTRREVESLLEAHPQAEGFLSDPPEKVQSEIDPAAIGLEPGTRLGPYEIIGGLGAGGMGDVHRARDTRLDREVAIKVLSRDLAADPRARDRFEREARVISRLTHPYICTLYDVGSAEVSGREAPFLVMELLEGETLASRLRLGPLPVGQAIQIASEILDALAAAHQRGIVHRDIKPANIMLTKSGVKLLDFGLARLRETTATPSASGSPAGDVLTVPGLVFGTVPYMAPEQIRGEEVDARTDVFAFGAVFYEMLTGNRAFDAGSEPALLATILEQDPIPVTTAQPHVSPALERLVAGCLAKAPAERWQHARDVRLALSAVAEGRTPSGTQVSLGGGAIAGLRVSRASAQPWRVHVAWGAVAVALALSAWMLARAGNTEATPVNAQPVVVLMDSPLQGRVYDPRTLAAGGTNADDITDALRDLPIATLKENTSPMWHREEEVRDRNPDLIISHLSCLYDQRFATQPDLREHLFDIAQSRLVGFFGYVASTNARTKFLVYSRGRFKEPHTWTNDVLTRFPQMSGRLFTMTVPGGEAATFRDPRVAQQLRALVIKILALPATPDTAAEGRLP